MIKRSEEKGMFGRVFTILISKLIKAGSLICRITFEVKADRK